MDTSSIMWAVVAGIGSMVVMTVFGVATFFGKRYIASQDRRNDTMTKTFSEIHDTIIEIKNLMNMNNVECNHKMGEFRERIDEHDERIENHEERIGKIEKKVR
jgi:ABC-type Fe3+-citrate transport system substrate-binding protein